MCKINLLKECIIKNEFQKNEFFFKNEAQTRTI